MELMRANRELFSRQEDERYESLQTLWDYCYQKKQSSRDLWVPPENIGTVANGSLKLSTGGDTFCMNDWAFGQLCRLAEVSKETVNRLTTTTAKTVFDETLPKKGDKPLQVLVSDNQARSIHGAAYTRLYDADLVMTIREFATDFALPQKGLNGATGFYAGEQDMFAFLIDPNGWCEVNGEAFAPGFFVWNSEVGRRSLGFESFWFQAVCANHIVWDATEVVSWKRKHTAHVGNGLSEIRRLIDELVSKRDSRKDGFFKIISKAMESRVENAEEAMKLLKKHGIAQRLSKAALELAQQQGRFTIWSLVDALTRLSREEKAAGDRTEADQKASSLLSLVA